MKNLLILLLLLYAGPLAAQVTTVQSGDHATFTRLVLTFPQRQEWVLGRTPQGYALQTSGAKASYNLSQVYNLIQKTRLRTITTDPQSGNLLLGIGCACHIIPFELGRRTLVLDIKDGPPPEASVFERFLADGTPSPPLQRFRPRPAQDARPGYDWLSPPTQVRDGQASPPPIPQTADRLNTDLQLNRFRSLIVGELSQGATAGVVELTVPESVPPAAEQGDIPAKTDQARTGIETLPGLALSASEKPDPDLTLTGARCPDPAETDLAAWRQSDNPAKDLAAARSKLLTEFDAPDSEAVEAAIKIHLYYGFGAEARQLMATFLPPDANIRLKTGLSYLIEGDPPNANPFMDMQSCDSAAALWALLAAPAETRLSLVNGAAVSRSFLSLPEHLRRLLGPETARRLALSGDAANAQVVTASFARAAPADAPDLALLRADQALQQGQPETAEAALPLAETGEVALASLLTLVEARFQRRQPVAQQDITALQGFAFEHGDGPQKPALDRAIALASALAGDFDTAFAYAEPSPPLQADVWALLAEVGAASAVLSYAVGVDEAVRKALPLQTRSALASRLTEAGLPNAATAWASAGDIAPDLAASVALANHDGQTALRLLAGQGQGKDAALLARAYAQLGALDLAAASYQQAGQPEEAARIARWTGPPPLGEGDAEDPWAQLARIAEPESPTPNPRSLEAAQGLVARSEQTRAAIADLLQSLPDPDPPP